MAAAGTRSPQDQTPKKRAWQPAFLSALQMTANVRFSCEAAGIDRSTAYARRHEDPAFALDWADALEDAADRLEGIALERATSREHPSDLLLIFLLKAARPEKFRENTTVEHKGTLRLEQMTDEELDDAIRRLDKADRPRKAGS